MQGGFAPASTGSAVRESPSQGGLSATKETMYMNFLKNIENPTPQ